ncbi:DUF2807 domain-containing protein [Sphingobium sp. AN641]|uniref:GIN domain-containing protein n=1 Tax=Sphingobium sp. AN641 TaxID=3133443 RepID=UPI0030BABE3E
MIARDGAMQGGKSGSVLVAAALAVAAPGAARADSQTFVVTSFDTLRVEGPVRVEVKTGAGVAARGEGARATLDRVRLDLSGRMLTVKLMPLRPGEKAAGVATLRLSTGELRRLVLGGGGSISVDRIKGMSADIATNGNGDVRAESMDVDRLTVALAGGGRVTLAGKAGVADIRVSGPGQVAADGLVARQARLFNDGPGTIGVTAAVSAQVRATGSGTVTVLGKAACTATNNGTGQIHCGGASY